MSSKYDLSAPRAVAFFPTSSSLHRHAARGHLLAPSYRVRVTLIFTMSKHHLYMDAFPSSRPVHYAPPICQPLLWCLTFLHCCGREYASCLHVSPCRVSPCPTECCDV